MEANGPLRTETMGKPAAIRILALLIFILCLQVPVLFNSLVVSERRGRRDGAQEEVAQKWGGQQELVGPALSIPWVSHRVETDARGVKTVSETPRRLVVLPESLHARGRVTTELRSRGIYQVPVYRLDAVLEGRFTRPDLAKLGVDSLTLDWSKATLCVGVSDPRAIQEQVALVWGDRRYEFQPGSGGFAEATSGVHVDLALDAPEWNTEFRVPIHLRGTRSVSVAPLGRTTTAELSGNWPSPSFQGPWLPAERTVSDTGFFARWQIPNLGRNYGQAWTEDMGPQKSIDDSAFGFDLLSDVDGYRMCDRTSKYAVLFFLLTFTALWLLEVLGGRPIHPVQYGLIGAALCMFLVLELALSEHIGFGLAYLASAAAVVGLIVSYAAGALGSLRRALAVGGALATLYACHYFVLRNEDYALLLGSLLLFGTLAGVMFVTRRIDWYQGGTSRAAG